MYKADHVGSFLRPQELLDARANGAAPEQLRATEDANILRILRKQQELGLQIFTDGEFRRRNFMSDFTDAVAGFDMAKAVARTWGGSKDSPPVSSITGVVTSKLRKVRPLTAHEVDFMKQHSPGATKVTLPSATQFPAISYQRGLSDAAYASPSELLWAIVAIMREEFAALAAQKVDYIQIDAPRYSYFMDPKWRAWIEEQFSRKADDLLD